MFQEGNVQNGQKNGFCRVQSLGTPNYYVNWARMVQVILKTFCAWMLSPTMGFCEWLSPWLERKLQICVSPSFLAIVGSIRIDLSFLHLPLRSFGTFPEKFQSRQRRLNLFFLCCWSHRTLLSIGLLNFGKTPCTPIGMSCLLLYQTSWRYEIWQTNDFIAQYNWQSPQTIN